MASTNKTTNYELSQFIETDRPAWLTDYNGDMRTIDSTMKAISDVASGASGSISELADRMSTAEGNISTNANDIDALEARADALEAQAQSTAGTIANIQTEQTAQNLGIEAATELGYNLARPYDSASTYAVGAYVLFQNTLYKCITAIATGEAFDPSKWLAIKATDEISGGGYTLPIASASTLGGVKVGTGLDIDPATGILSSSAGTIETRTFNTVFSGFASTTSNTFTYRLTGSTTQTASVNLNFTSFYGLNRIKTFKIGDLLLINLSVTPQFDPITINNICDFAISFRLAFTNSDFYNYINKAVSKSFPRVMMIGATGADSTRCELTINPNGLDVIIGGNTFNTGGTQYSGISAVEIKDTLISF